MLVRVLEKIIADFNKIAKGDGPEAKPYVVDVFLKGGGGYTAASGQAATYLSGTMHHPDKEAVTVHLDVLQYGPGTDFNACVIDVESIAAVRMRKPE